MENMIYDVFVLLWNLNGKYEIYDVGGSMILECEMSYMVALCVNDPSTWNMTHDGFVPRRFFNARYVIWCICASMSLESEIIYLVYVMPNSINWKYDIVPR
jgi:hypothetical protein